MMISLPRSHSQMEKKMLISGAGRNLSGQDVEHQCNKNYQCIQRNTGTIIMAKLSRSTVRWLKFVLFLTRIDYSMIGPGTIAIGSLPVSSLIFSPYSPAEFFLHSFFWAQWASVQFWISWNVALIRYYNGRTEEVCAHDRATGKEQHYNHVMFMYHRWWHNYVDMKRHAVSWISYSQQHVKYKCFRWIQISKVIIIQHQTPAIMQETHPNIHAP